MTLHLPAEMLSNPSKCKCHVKEVKSATYGQKGTINLSDDEIDAMRLLKEKGYKITKE